MAGSGWSQKPNEAVAIVSSYGDKKSQSATTCLATWLVGRERRELQQVCDNVQQAESLCDVLFVGGVRNASGDRVDLVLLLLLQDGGRRGAERRRRGCRDGVQRAARLNSSVR